MSYYESLIRADQRPGRDAYNRYEELSTALGSQLEKLEQLLSTTNGVFGG